MIGAVIRSETRDVLDVFAGMGDRRRYLRLMGSLVT